MSLSVSGPERFSRWKQIKLLLFGLVMGMTIVLLYFALRNIRADDETDLVPFSQFYMQATEGGIDQIRIVGTTAYGRLDDEVWIRTRLAEDHGEFLAQVAKSGVVVEIVQTDLPRWQRFLLNALPVICLLGFWAWLVVVMRRARNAAAQKTNAETADANHPPAH